MEEAGPTSGDLETIGRKALVFRRYVLRRAYGTYYAVWALALSLYLLIPEAIYLEFGSSFWNSAAAAAVGMAVAFSAMVMVSRNFKQNARAMRLRKALHPGSGGQGSRSNTAWWWGALIVLFFLSYVFQSLVVSFLFYGILVLTDVLIYGYLRRSFPDGVPFEGILAVATYGVGVAASFMLALLTGSPLLPALPWTIVIAVWLFASIFSFKRAPEELVELLY